jgi:hypothetical protein
MDDNNYDDYEEDDHSELPPFQHPWRELTTFVIFLLAIIWLFWEGISWLIQIL